MKKNLRIIMIFLFFLGVSCSGNSLIQDASIETGRIMALETESAQQVFPYVLGPGDEISVKVWRNDDLARSIQVDPSGNIQFPLVGELKASGLTIIQLRQKMTSLLSEYIVDPQVDINVSRTTGLRLHILGEVNSPGTLEWRMGMLAWEAIAKAGGFNRDADMNNVLLIRNEDGQASIRVLTLMRMLQGEQLTQDIYLKNGDVVYVLPTVIADVQRFMNRLYSIVAPIVNIESGIVLYPQVRDVLRGKETTGTIVVPR